MSLTVYKKEHGFYTRFICFILANFLGFYAALKLFYFGSQPFGYTLAFWDNERILDNVTKEEVFPWPLWADWVGSIPVVGEMFTPGLFFSALFFLLLALFFYWASFCHARYSEFLIETEAELRKVSWPNRDELIGSSTVVVITVIVLSVYLGLVDIVLGNIFSNLL